MRAGCTDWDGTEMVDETPPMDCLTVGDVRDAITEIQRLGDALKRANDQAEQFERASKLPDRLLDIIGRYGNARSGGCDEAEIIYRWEELCGAIKQYAATWR